MKTIVLLNPAAGRGNSRHKWEQVEKIFKGRGYRYELRVSNGPGEISTLTRQAVDEGFTTIVTVGGDGTVYEALNCLINHKVKLGIVPAGTGNDFAKSLCIVPEAKKVAQLIIDGHSKKIDLGHASLGSGIQKYFVNVAGVGFDAEVTMTTNTKFKQFKGPGAYVASLLKVLLTYQSRQMVLTIDGQHLSCKAMLASVGNGKYYGGGMMITPKAQLQDGLLDLCLIKELRKLELLRAFPKIFKGTHLLHPKVEYFQAKQVALDVMPPAYVQTDGEVIGMSPVTFSVYPQGIDIICNG